jgi:hypothetical protein
MRNLFIKMLAIALFTSLLYGCAGVGLWEPRRGAGYGPPPHAPAHGYRHKHGLVELVFDSNFGVYTVVGYPRHYFYDNRYYRLKDDIWWVSILFEGPWVVVSEADLPPGLRKMKGKDTKIKRHPVKDK